MTTGKTIALKRWKFVDKVVSSVLKMLSRLVITFLPRSKCLFISWLQSKSALILEPKKIKSATVSTVSPSGPITSWQIDGETVETVADFILGSSKITEDDDCSHEIKRHWLLARKAMTNLDSILKSRDITLPAKVRLVKAMVFPLVMYGCESWTIKEAECQRIDAFELWCWRRLLRVLRHQGDPTSQF